MGRLVNIELTMIEMVFFKKIDHRLKNDHNGAGKGARLRMKKTIFKITALKIPNFKNSRSIYFRNKDRECHSAKTNFQHIPENPLFYFKPPWASPISGSSLKSTNQR